MQQMVTVVLSLISLKTVKVHQPKHGVCGSIFGRHGEVFLRHGEDSGQQGFIDHLVMQTSLRHVDFEGTFL